MIPHFNPSDPTPDYHVQGTIQLCELVNAGVVTWGENGWTWDYYNEEQFERVCRKFNAYYWTRQIGIVPPGLWKQQVIARFDLVMPKYKLLYKQLDTGIDILADTDTYGKSRSVDSNFPQTMLGGTNQDYASYGNDRQYETIVQGNPVSNIQQFEESYDDADLMLIKEFETLFSCIMSFNMNTIV